MAEINKSNALPVESPSIEAELKAAFARIAAVPAGPTLVARISSDLWATGVDGCICAGSFSNDPNELDDCDVHQKKIA